MSALPPENGHVRCTSRCPLCAILCGSAAYQKTCRQSKLPSAHLGSDPANGAIRQACRLGDPIDADTFGQQLASFSDLGGSIRDHSRLACGPAEMTKEACQRMSDFVKACRAKPVIAGHSQRQIELRRAIKAMHEYLAAYTARVVHCCRAQSGKHRTASQVSAKFNWMLERELTGLRYSYDWPDH
jgi:hypothetical protein